MCTVYVLYIYDMYKGFPRRGDPEISSFQLLSFSLQRSKADTPASFFGL